jgi:hypothetical protein
LPAGPAIDAQARSLMAQQEVKGLALAVIDKGQIVHVAFQEGLEGKHHPCALLRVGRRPSRLGLFRTCDSLSQKLCRRQFDQGLHFARRRVVNIVKAAGICRF